MCCFTCPLTGVSGAAVVRRSFFIGVTVAAALASLSSTLIETYKQIHSRDGVPSWAWNFPPSIPLIGKDFEPGKGLLIYGSAENLSWMNRKPIPPRFLNDHAWNRYRVVYEEEGRGTFFPGVGIKPVSEGGLLSAGLYISERFGLPVSPNPHDFLEQTSVTNWSKFTIKSETNEDEVKDPTKLARSLSYVVSELMVLRPAVATLPSAFWKNPLIHAAMTGASPHTCFIPLYQCGSRVINRHLKDRIGEAERCRRLSKGTALEKWLMNIGKRIGIDPWRYIAHVAEILGRSPMRYSDNHEGSAVLG
jgi:hypothetical protein